MEPWQIRHITKNLPALLSRTVCNAQLLAELKAAELLADVDVKVIEAKSNHYEKATMLNDILQTRNNGYYGLIKALIATKQSGACKILLEISTSKIGSLQISLQGVVHHVSDLLTQDEIQAVSSWINDIPSMDECLKIHESIQAAETLELVRDTIPKPHAFYIPRLLSCRLGVNPDLFKKPCTDVFVFKEIEQPQLRKFVKLHTIASSSEQLLQRNITSRFLLLDCGNDWNRICTNAKRPVHLMKYNKCTQAFLLEATTGGTSALRSYLQYHGEPESHYVSEDAFIEMAGSSNACGFCICDSPGMGKSLLLANMARKAREKWPERIVGFIQLQKLQNVLKEDSNLDDATLKTFGLISTSLFASQILYKLYKRNEVRLELFFDGLDEVQHENLDTVTAFFKKICEDVPTDKVYVTSRPAVRVQLEKAMGMIAYDIQPFKEETQRNYLTTHWAHTDPKANMQKLVEYAKYCIQGLQQTLKDKEKNIAGVPLMCWLLAEVYTGRATTYADATRKKSVKLPNKFVNSLYHIYKKFLARQLGKTTCKFACMHKYDLAEPVCDTACLVKSFHVWLALKLILPTYSVKLEKCVSHFDSLLRCQILVPGILEEGQQTDTYVFMHRTFAEFLVAEYFAKNVLWELDEHRTIQLSPQISYLGLNEVLITDKIMHDHIFTHRLYHSVFREKVVIYFLDSMILQNCKNLTLYKASISPFNKTFLDWIEGCLHGSYPGLLNLLMQIVAKFTSAPLTWTLLAYHKLCSLWESFNKPIVNALHVAAVYCDTETIENLIQFFLKVFNPDMMKALQNEHVITKTIELVIVRGDYEVVRYLGERFPSTINKDVFYFLLEHLGHAMKQANTEANFKMLDLFLTHNSSLLEERFASGLTPLLQAVKLKNLEAVMFFLVRKSNIYAVDPDGCAILHIAAQTRDENFFCKIMSTTGQKWINGQTNPSLTYLGSHRVPENVSEPTSIEQIFEWRTISYQLTPLHMAVVLLRDMQLETLDYLLACGNEKKVKAQQFTCVNIDAVDSDGRTALHLALMFQSLQVVKHLIARGADWTLETKNGCNAVHICASHRTQHLQYLLELGCNVNEVDSNGNNALQCAVNQPYDIYKIFDISRAQILIDAGVNIFSKNFDGITARELAVRNGWPKKIVNLL